ncbi:MAG: hypothetical protein ACXVNM_11065 [Bacteroidia bacterium]
MRDTEFGDKAYRYKFTFRKKFIFIPFLVLGGTFLIGYIVMQAWNHFFPVIFHTGPIDYWQALWLFILAKILFGFGGGGHRGAPWMRNRMERFKNMSPEEKQRFREEMRSRCGKWGMHRGGFDWDEPTPKSAEDSSKPVE